MVTVKIGVSTVFPRWCFYHKNEKCLTTVQVSTVFPQCFNGDKKSQFLTLLKTTDVNAVSKGVSSSAVVLWRKKGVSKVFLTVTKRCSKVTKKSCFDGEKEVFPQWFYVDKKVFQQCSNRYNKVVSAEKKEVFLL